MTKSGKFQMTIHIDYDREENKIELILESQGNVIRTLIPHVFKDTHFVTVYFSIHCMYVHFTL